MIINLRVTKKIYFENWLSNLIYGNKKGNDIPWIQSLISNMAIKIKSYKH